MTTKTTTTTTTTTTALGQPLRGTLVGRDEARLSGRPTLARFLGVEIQASAKRSASYVRVPVPVRVPEFSRR
jgi:hypothetical protein